MSRFLFALAPVLLLAACATPQERCIKQGASEETQLIKRISETEGNITRGYAIHRQTVPETVFYTCDSIKDGKIVGRYPCPETYYRTVETPVAIDISEERRKLKTLKEVLPAASRRAAEAADQCRILYPS